jgi:mRNA-degrading endonuclease RelE of RelBE toxin-antitoxin system
MEYRVFDQALEEIQKMDRGLQKRFIKHIEKVANMPPRRHLRHGNPHYVEKVTRGARFAYKIEDGTIHVVRCFATHKEYENWYRQL